MVNYGLIAIPLIAILVIGGVISFFVVFSFYPEKHENVSIKGKCYELVDTAHEKITNLTAEMKITKMLLQISKIESQNALIPIIFNGKDSETQNFIDKNNLAVISNKKVIYFPNINGSVVTAYITKTDLQGIVGNLSILDVIPSSKSVAGSIGIQPNEYLTYDEHKDVSLLMDKIQKHRLMDIIYNSDGVSPAECRNET
ncbi:MAG TPA: hypothetical protein VJ599_03120 [Nitrososphaeraceae archaeon]|nr:hypothetical protein [Nitrososphaeraceae archaeon]